MQFGGKERGYDLASTTFSPEGRIFQVEYAIEAVRHGTGAIGIKSKEGVVLTVEKRVGNLQKPDTIEKVFDIDDHIGAAIAGLTADARVLIDHARVQAQINKITYGESISTIELVRKVCDQKQIYTINAGARPFGVSFLIAGVDEDMAPNLFMTDPSGAYWSFKATAIGQNADDVKDYLASKYHPNLSLDDAVVLSINGLKKSMSDDENLDPVNVEIAVVKTEDRKFYRYSIDEIKEYIPKAKESE
ncbi:MAG: archaeal proteasome endopeptidase complex subunit alpha [Candidatus Lokiarchaeota archaeon]|nr:archaeal proteasome endopeptidase complex subunit alpha [Candidatus Lokiarchaeota archaeon]